MSYSEMTPGEQTHLRDYAQAVHDRLAAYRDNKETMAFAGLAIFLGAVATALTSRDWPPTFAKERPWLIVLAFSILWVFIAVYLRYQLRRRRWAAIRVAGCDWLLAEWLPESPHAMANEDSRPAKPAKPGPLILLVDIIWPLKSAVTAVDPNLRVYPDEIERSWVLASKRGTDALLHERLIHIAGWVGYAAVLTRTLLA
jgi:hypothetical protein